MYRVNRNADSLFRFQTVAIALICLVGAIASVDAQAPNVVFILVDDLGYLDVSYHGSAVQTPNIDRLAETGVKLENYYVQPLCTPTRSALLSGRYQIHTGLQHLVIRPCQRNALPSEMPTVANKLRQQGYSTHMVGKWHIGHYEKQVTPLYRGFDSYFGFLIDMQDHYNHSRCCTLNPFEEEEEENQDSDKGYQDDFMCGLDLRDDLSPAREYDGLYSTHLFTSKAVEVIKEHAASNTEKPLFLYLPYQGVHSPNQVPEEYEEPYSYITDKNRRIHAGMVACLDEGVGNVTKALQDNGLWNNTILIFSTDNGGQVFQGGNNWPLRGWKGTLWEGGMRGVGFVNSPLIQQPGTVNTGLIHVTDWFPTLLTLAGGQTDGLDLDGFDVWKTISEGAESPRVELLHSIDPLKDKRGIPLNISDFDNRIAAAIRFENWKLITGNPGGGRWVAPPEDPEIDSIPDPDPIEKNIWLFDLSEDPNETTDVFKDNQDVAADLLNRLQKYQSTAVEARFPRDDPLCDPALHDGVWSPWV